MPEKLHQGVHVCVGQFGGEGVPESVHQNPSGALSVEPGLLEGPQHPVLHRAPGDPVAIRTDEQRGSGRPGSQPGFPLLLSTAGKAGGSRVQVLLEHVNEHLLHWDSAVLVALAAHMDDTALIGGADVANIGADELVGSQSGQNRGQDKGPVALAQSEPRRDARSASSTLRAPETVSTSSPLGSDFGTFSRPISGIGLDWINSAV